MKSINALSGIISALLTLAAGTLGTTHATTITENFNDGQLPASLEISGSDAIFASGGVLFNGARTNLRTVNSDFYNSDFVAEVTLSTGSSIAFFGLGEGSPTGGSNEPAGPIIGLRMHSDFAGIGQNGYTDNYLSFGDAGFSGSGVHRLRLTWDGTAKSGYFEIDEDYSGGAFTADFTTPLLNGADNGFTSANARIYFGGDSNASFDDLQITSSVAAPVPEPSACLLSVASGGLFLLRRRGSLPR